MPIRGVLFDLDGTLHDRAATIRDYLTGHARRFDTPPGYRERFTELDDFGYQPKPEVFAALVAEFGLTHDPDSLFADFRQHKLAHVQLMPNAHALLVELRRRGIRVGVVTNGRTEMQSAVLERLGLLPLIDDHLISEAAGIAKPDPRIYALALSRLHLSAGETLFVGDSPANDLAGPQCAGMRAAWLPTGHLLPPHITPDFHIKSLLDVLDIVDEINNNPATSRSGGRME